MLQPGGYFEEILPTGTAEEGWALCKWGITALGLACCLAGSLLMVPLSAHLGIFSQAWITEEAEGVVLIAIYAYSYKSRAGSIWGPNNMSSMGFHGTTHVSTSAFRWAAEVWWALFQNKVPVPEQHRISIYKALYWYCIFILSLL